MRFAFEARKWINLCHARRAGMNCSRENYVCAEGIFARVWCGDGTRVARRFARQLVRRSEVTSEADRAHSGRSRSFESKRRENLTGLHAITRAAARMAAVRNLAACEIALGS